MNLTTKLDVAKMAEMRLKQIVLDRYAIEAQAVVAEDLLRNGSWSVNCDYVTSHFALHFRSFILGHVVDEISEEMRVEYPKDWWQALKARWFAAWALRRWPVRMEVVAKRLTLTAKECYPGLTIPNRQRAVLMYVKEETE